MRTCIGRVSRLFASALALVGSAASALAQNIRAELWQAGNPTPIVQTFSAGSDVTLGSIATDIERINVYSNGALVNIGTVSFDAGSRTSQLDFFVGQGAILNNERDPLTPSALNWSGLNLSTATQSKVRMSAGISGDLTGSVAAATINRLQVGGTVFAGIYAGGQLGAQLDIGAVVAGTLAANPEGISTPGSIGLVRATGTGVVLGHAIVAGEAIGDIEAPNGNIGDMSIPSDLPIQARDGINSITASAINANIFANAGGGETYTASPR